MRLIASVLPVALLLGPILLLGGGASEDALAPAAMGGFLLFGLGLLLLSRRGEAGGGGGSREESDRRYLATLVLAGFATRVVVAAAIHWLGLHHVIAPDEGTFDGNGRQFCLWLQGKTPYRLSVRFIDSLQVGYYYLIGFIYYVFGTERFLPILVNCVCGSLAALPVYSITKDLAGRAAARPAALLVTFFPSVLLWSTLLVRDSLVILLILLLIRSVMKLRQRFSPLELMLFLVYVMGLGTLRQYILVLVAAGAVASFLVGKSGRTGRSFVVGLLVILGLLGVMNYVGFGLWEMERASLYHLNMQRQFNSLPTAAGSIAPDVDISHPTAALTWLPVGMLYFLGSPFPWQVLSPRQILALPDVFTWYLLLPVILIGLVRVIRTRFRDAFMLLITITLITVLYSLVEGNLGIIFRHRAQVLAPMMVLAGVGISVRSARRAGRTDPTAAEDPARAPVPAGAPA